MTQANNALYAALDHPDVSRSIFHPRATPGGPDANAGEHLIEVAPGVHVGSRFHLCDRSGANILFFHGNGEIVADYDELAPLYTALGINFLVFDYRGYGRSNGRPTVSAMMSDCHQLYTYTAGWLAANGYAGPTILMGRSLGSASALELAAAFPQDVDGLIIESGFAFAEPLLQLLGVDVNRIGFNERRGFGNLEKIARYTGPTLIIHAEYDHIIPYSDGQALLKASQSPQKRLVRIENANHNDIFFVGMNVYMQAVREFIEGLALSGQQV